MNLPTRFDRLVGGDRTVMGIVNRQLEPVPGIADPCCARPERSP